MSTSLSNRNFFSIPLAGILYQETVALKQSNVILPFQSIDGRKANKDFVQRAHSSLLQSQIILFSSRKKWGMLYSLATVVGLFLIPGFSGVLSTADMLSLFQRIIPTPMISLLIATGMYILNDVIDADLDKANGKNRPIPSGRVSKRQAWIFVVSTNGFAVLLAYITFNVASMLLIIPMLLIGILYSAPRVKLMNRFVIKTLSIASFYVLCAFLGMTSGYGMNLAVASSAPAFHAMMLLGIMIFISSTLNDLGDVGGDKTAGRRTIPIVMGGTGAIKLLIILAGAMFALSLVLYGNVNPIVLISSSAFALFVISRLLRMKQSLKNMDMELMRAQHKKIFPLHMVLQAILCAGAFLPPI